MPSSPDAPQHSLFAAKGRSLSSPKKADNKRASGCGAPVKDDSDNESCSAAEVGQVATRPRVAAMAARNWTLR